MAMNKYYWYIIQVIINHTQEVSMLEFADTHHPFKMRFYQLDKYNLLKFPCGVQVNLINWKEITKDEHDMYNELYNESQPK